MGNKESHILDHVVTEDSQEEFCSRLLEGQSQNKSVNLVGLEFSFSEETRENGTKYWVMSHPVQIPFTTELTLEKIFLTLSILTENTDFSRQRLPFFEKSVVFLLKLSPSNFFISKLEFSYDGMKCIEFKSMQVALDTDFDMNIDPNLKIHVSKLTMSIDPVNFIHYKTECQLFESTLAIFQTNEYTWERWQPNISASFTINTKNDLKAIDPVYFGEWKRCEPYFHSPWHMNRAYEYRFTNTFVRLTEIEQHGMIPFDHIFLPRSGVFIEDVKVWPYRRKHSLGSKKCIGDISSRKHKDLQFTFGQVREIAPRVYPEEDWPFEELLVRDGLAPIFDFFGIDFCDTSYVPKQFDENGDEITEGIDDLRFEFTYDRGPRREYPSYIFSLEEERFLLYTSVGIEIDFEARTVWKTLYGNRHHTLPSKWKNSTFLLKTLKGMTIGAQDLYIKFY